MRDLMNSDAAVMRPVKKELIDIDLDDDDDYDEDVLCGEVRVESMMDVEQVDNPTDSGEINPSNMQQTVDDGDGDDDGDDDDDWDTRIDPNYMLLLDSCKEDGSSHLSDNALRSIRYEVDNGGYDKREFKAVIHKQRGKEDQETIRVTKKNLEPKPHVQKNTEKTTKEAGYGLRRRESLVTEKSVEAMRHLKRKSQDNDDASEKENAEDYEMVLDEGYKSYLTWLVENSKVSRTSSEKEIQVKCEEEAAAMSLSDSDSDTIVMEDRPFLDEEDSPFVPSKCDTVTDLHEENSDQRSCWFRKEVMNVLKKPFTETELKELHNEASERKKLKRSWQLLDGGEINCTTKLPKPSYLDDYPDVKEMYIESLREKDGHKALNLLRGFIFYLKNVVREDAFKPWLDQECLKITSSEK